MNKISKLLFIGALGVSCIASSLILANNESVQTPVNAAVTVDEYYSNADTSSVQNLISSLHTITNKGYKTIGYDGLWDAYKTTDLKPDGYIMDYYCDISNYKPSDKGSSAKQEGVGGYNREHSIPKSWWGGGTQNQGNDIIIVIPTDVYNNNRRANYPLGENKGEDYSSHNQYVKLGNCTFGDFIDTCFEPPEEFKGDLARIYMYAIVKWDGYKWTTDNGAHVFDNKCTAPTWGFDEWAQSLLMKWHLQDPVSEWEASRNNKVYSVQNNRNPFVDHPEWADFIWGNGILEEKELTSLVVSGTPTKTVYSVGESFNPEGLTVTAYYDNDTSENVTSKVVWTPEEMKAGTTSVTGTYKYKTVSKTVEVKNLIVKTLSSLTCEGTPNKLEYIEGESFDSTGLTITATYSDGDSTIVTNDVKWQPDPLQVGTIMVTGTYGYKTVTVNGLTVKPQDKYTLATSLNELNEGDKVVFAYNNENKTAGPLENSVMTPVSSTFSSDKKHIEALGSGTLEFKLKKFNTNWIFECENQELGCTSEKKLSWDEGTTTWNISFSSNNVIIQSTNSSLGSIKYNTQSPRFTTYNSNQAPIQIYRKFGGQNTTSVESVTLNVNNTIMYVGDQLQLIATVLPVNATNKSVVWMSTNYQIAEVDNNGLVKAIKTGDVTITVQSIDGGLTAKCTIAIREKSSNGCPGSIVAMSSVMFGISLTGLALLFVKKKHE